MLLTFAYSSMIFSVEFQRWKWKKVLLCMHIGVLQSLQKSYCQSTSFLHESWFFIQYIISLMHYFYTPVLCCTVVLMVIVHCKGQLEKWNRTHFFSILIHFQYGVFFHCDFSCFFVVYLLFKSFTFFNISSLSSLSQIISSPRGKTVKTGLIADMNKELWYENMFFVRHFIPHLFLRL